MCVRDLGVDVCVCTYMIKDGGRMCKIDTYLQHADTHPASDPSTYLIPQQKPQAPQGGYILRQAFEATGRMVRPYLAELEPTAEEDFIRWAQVEVASVEGVGKNSVRVAVRVF